MTSEAAAATNTKTRVAARSTGQPTHIPSSNPPSPSVCDLAHNSLTLSNSGPAIIGLNPWSPFVCRRADAKKGRQREAKPSLFPPECVPPLSLFPSFLHKQDTKERRYCMHGQTKRKRLNPGAFSPSLKEENSTCPSNSRSSFLLSLHPLVCIWGMQRAGRG